MKIAVTLVGNIEVKDVMRVKITDVRPDAFPTTAAGITDAAESTVAAITIAVMFAADALIRNRFAVIGATGDSLEFTNSEEKTEVSFK